MKTDVLVIGGGPAGLSAALAAKKLGAKVLIVDENPKPGGQLIKQTHKFFGSKKHWCGVRGIDIASLLLNLVNEHTRPDIPTPSRSQGRAKQVGKAEIWLNASAVGIYNENNKKVVGVVKDEEFIRVETRGIIVSAGAQENMLNFENNDLPGVYGAGAVQTLVNVYGVPPGEKVLMIGSGNIGLIVSYQLMQAGIQVVGIVEAMPKIGGYLVHSAKVRRLGIPIWTSHTIKEALGTNEVKGAVIAELDSKWNEIPGTDKKIDCDVLCLAVGLTPSTELLQQAGCKMQYISELGGYVAWHNEYMQTSIPEIYVAGDISGVEEAVAAILEGRIAGASCAKEITGTKLFDAEEIIHQTLQELAEFRNGPFGEKASIGKKKLLNGSLL
ncbi:FAD-dependent oxidoreductase [candidate division WOR-3 bacterium]|nr:FAD-dependent oxidoreductase [candidate division WOR-3 bacterium]